MRCQVGTPGEARLRSPWDGRARRGPDHRRAVAGSRALPGNDELLGSHATPRRTGPGRRYTRRMDRRAALVLLAVLAIGVFLAGLELMVTAVALPSIVTDLASWTELRKASWIINGYLLAYVVTMPLAGRLADQWGVRRLFLGRPRGVHYRVAARRARAIARAPHRRPARPGGRRRDPGAGRDGGRVAPVRRSRPAPRPRGDRGADVPRDGGRPVRGGLDHRRDPSLGGARRCGDHGRPAPRRARGAVAIRLLHQRADRDRRPRPGLAGGARLGDAATERAAGRRRRSRLLARPGPRPSRDHPRGERADRGPVRRPGDGHRRAGSRGGPGGRPRDAPRAPPPFAVPRSAALPLDGVLVGCARLAPHRLRLRDGDRRRRGVRGPRALWRARCPASRARGPGRRDGGRRARLRVRAPRRRAPARDRGRPRPEHAGPRPDGRLDAGDGAAPRSPDGWRRSGSGSGSR